jgi:hypothetical protein
MATIILHLNAYVKVVPPFYSITTLWAISKLNTKLIPRINIWLKQLKEAQNS